MLSTTLPRVAVLGILVNGVNALGVKLTVIGGYEVPFASAASVAALAHVNFCPTIVHVQPVPVTVPSVNCELRVSST